MTPEECTEIIDPAVQIVGAAFYFDPATVEYGKTTVGLDGFRFYVAGRAGVLGDVGSTIVSSAFGYFNPGLVEKMWTTALERTSADSAKALASEYLGCAHRFGAERFEGLELEGFGAAASALIDGIDPAALTLFAGYRDMPRPADPLEAGIHHAILLRELRGSVHLAAIAATGLPSKVAHTIRRPGDVENFGWGADEGTTVSETDRALLVEVDRLTDRAMANHLSTISSDERQALAAGAEQMLARLS